MQTKFTIFGKEIKLPFTVSFGQFLFLIFILALAGSMLLMKNCRIDLKEGEIEMNKQSIKKGVAQ